MLGAARPQTPRQEGRPSCTSREGLRPCEPRILGGWRFGRPWSWPCAGAGGILAGGCAPPDPARGGRPRPPSNPRGGASPSTQFDVAGTAIARGHGRAQARAVWVFVSMLLPSTGKGAGAAQLSGTSVTAGTALPAPRTGVATGNRSAAASDSGGPGGDAPPAGSRGGAPGRVQGAAPASKHIEGRWGEGHIDDPPGSPEDAARRSWRHGDPPGCLVSPRRWPRRRNDTPTRTAPTAVAGWAGSPHPVVGCAQPHACYYQVWGERLRGRVQAPTWPRHFYSLS